MGPGPCVSGGSLHDELEFVRSTFNDNEYSQKQIQDGLNSPARTTKLSDKPTLVFFLLYIGELELA